ncbi:MAG: hypothetical protein K0R16_1796 [Nitrososphaeraceae archaeon]|nr:hypothetical protein [Nitrososphaeraceae archaeon]
MQVIAIPFLLCFIIFVSSFSCIYSASSVYAAGTEQEAYTKVNQINPSYIAATNGYLIKQLGNFEFTVDLDANQIFPNEKIKQDMVSKYKSAKYNIANLEYELIGFKIIASDIKIHANPTLWMLHIDIFSNDNDNIYYCLLVILKIQRFRLNQ